jgi:DNA-binding ferritin-like protein
MKFIGRNGSNVLFASDTAGVIIDEETNTIIDSGSVQTFISSSDWSLDSEEPNSLSIELATASVSDLNIHILSNTRMYTIPKAAQTEAKRALEWHKEEGRGGTPVGLNTARTLAKGGQIGIEKVRHIAKYFPRHEVDKKGEGYKPGEDGYPSNGRIAWALWGGDAARRWASAIVERENAHESEASTFEDIKPVDLSYFDTAKDSEFTIRVYGDGSGIDRLYMTSEDGNVFVWDDGTWSDLGESSYSFSDIDDELDGEPDGIIRYHFPIDAETAVVASAVFDSTPFLIADVHNFNVDETEMVASALPEVDWSYIDSITFADAAAPAPTGDGVDTPEEKAKRAQSQVRDASGKFAKMGGKVIIANNPAAIGTIEAVNGAQADVRFANGKVATVDIATTKPAGDTAPAPLTENPYARFGKPLDVSGILGEPRDSSNPVLAGLPNRLPPLTQGDIHSMLTDWPAWVADQRSSFESTRQATPSVKVNTQADDVLAPNAYNDPYLRRWLDAKYSKKGVTSYPNRSWYNPVRTDDVEKAKSAKEVGYKGPSGKGSRGGKGGSSWSWSTTVGPRGKTTTTRTRTTYSDDSIIATAGAPVALTPDTSDIAPIYMAIVAQDDPQAVMDLVALIPANSETTNAATFSRKDGKWVADSGVLADLNSATPPPVIVLSDEDLADVLHQIEGDKDSVTASVSNFLALLWDTDGDLLAVTAAGGVDRNRGNAETLRRYWTIGEGAAKIRWGTPGDWSRCVRHLSKYLGPRAKGYCQLRHKDALGIYTATHAKRDRAKHFSEEELFETIITNEDMAKSVNEISQFADDLFDDSWTPELEIHEMMEEVSEYDGLLAAGGVDRNKGNAEKLRRYWTIGEGGAKIRWNTGGDWKRCVSHLSKYMGPRAKGYCALRHKEMTGLWTGDKAHRQMYGRKGAFATYSDDYILSSEDIISFAELTAQANEAKHRIVASGEMTSDGAAFYMPLVLPEDVESGDGRKFAKGAISMRELPLPLMWQIKTAQGHDGSVVVGRIDKMERTDDGVGNAYGVFDSGEYGKEAERLVRGGFIKGISADLDRFEADEEEASADEDKKIGGSRIKITKGRIMGVTLVPKPAFQECKIMLVDDINDVQEEPVLQDGEYVEQPAESDAAALVACAAVVASIPVTPPASWFENPKLDGPTPLTVTEDGKVFGHIAAWHVDHIGMAFGTKPPRSKSQYAYFHTGIIRTEEGSDVPVGQLTLAGGHASLEASARSAAKHYDDTGSAFADVHAGEDNHGIWVAGALRPSISPEQVRAIRASAPSGDWRPIQGALELVAVCQVNVPGFPIARARVASGSVMALVAAGAQVLARMKSDPVAELTARLDRLENPEKESLLSAMEEVKYRFSTLKGDLIVSEEPVIADGGVDVVEPMAVDVLEKLLSDVISFYFRAHGYHWNVKGSDFSQYHGLFGEIYEDVYGSVDPLAENILKMGYDAPFTLGEFMHLRSIDDSSVTMDSPHAMAYDLCQANDVLIAELKAAFDIVDAANEQGIANFIADRIDSHQKWAWQLKSSLVPEGMEKAEEQSDEEFFVTVFTALDDLGLVATAGGPSEAVREELAKKGEALPDGSYPIRNVAELKKAIKAYGRSNPGDRAKVRRHIQKRARSLKSADLIPDEWKNLSSTGMELSVSVADLRSRINQTAITAAAPADTTEEGGVDPKALTPEGVSSAPSTTPVNPYEQKYSAKTQPRDAQGKFRLVLARLKQDLGDASLGDVAKKVAEAENLDNAGDYVESAKSAKDVINIVDRIDTKALDPESVANVRMGTEALGKAIANLPLPFKDQSEKIRFSDVPPALAKLIEDMITKVEKKIGQKDASEATIKLKGFMSGSDVFSQSEISSEMNKLLRLLT